MKTVGILGISSLLLNLVAAAPLDKRVIVWHTVTQVVVETVDVTTTITVGANHQEATQAAASPPTSTTTTTSPTDSPTTPAAAVVQEPTPSASPSSPEYSWTYSFSEPTQEAPASPATTESQAEPTTPPPVEVYAPEPTTSSPPPPPTTPQPEPTTSTTVPAPYSPPPTNTGSPSGGECSEGNPCSGDITFFATDGYLACGNFGVNGQVEHVVALPHEFMGTASNNNPYCGKKVTITRGDKSCEAVVWDKCMGCTGHSIDLSYAAFRELGHEDEGRVHDVTWYLHD